MRFLVFRCLGIISVGVAAFFLAGMQGPYAWDIFFTYVLRDHIYLLVGYISFLVLAAFRHVYLLVGYSSFLVVAAILLSVEHEKEEWAMSENGRAKQ